MRTELKAIIAAILALWLFFMGFEIGSYVEKQKIGQELTDQSVTQLTAPTLAPTTEPTAEPATEVPTEVPSETQATENVDPISDIGSTMDLITTYPDSELSAATTEKPKETTTQKAEPTTQNVSALSKTQVLQRVTKAVNELKGTQNMTARKQEATTVNIVDCSVQSAVSLLNNIISKNAVTETVTYVFVNGKATGYDDNGKPVENEGEVTPNHIIPPGDAAFTLPEAGVAAATAQQKGKEIVYTIKLAEEATTLENPIPPYNAQAIGYLNLADLDVPGATITSANMHYPGSTLTLTTDTQGKVKQLEFRLPMDGSGSAKMGFLSGSASFEGVNTETWTFSY